MPVKPLFGRVSLTSKRGICASISSLKPLASILSWWLSFEPILFYSNRRFSLRDKSVLDSSDHNSMMTITSDRRIALPKQLQFYIRSCCQTHSCFRLTLWSQFHYIFAFVFNSQLMMHRHDNKDYKLICFSCFLNHLYFSEPGFIHENERVFDSLSF